MTIVTFVHSVDYDWIGMYLDGTLAEEGHSLDEREVATLLLGKNVKEVHEFHVADHLDKYGNRCPYNLGDIPQEDRIK